MIRRRASRRNRIEEAMRRSRTRQLLWWLGARWSSILGAAACFALAFGLLTSSRFRVEQVVVRRESPSAQAAITRATQLSQVVGQNIFLLNAARVAQEVASIPSVRSVRVIPRLPNVVEIELVERVPVAYWQAANGSFLVDDQGVVMAQAGDAPPPEVQGFVVHDVTGLELHPGDRIDPHLVIAARELVKALPAAGAGVQEVEYSALGITLVTDGGWRVIFGQMQDLNEKLATFAAFVELARAQNLKVALLDLRPKDRPYYRLAS